VRGGWQNTQWVEHLAVLKNFVMQMWARRSSSATHIADVGAGLNAGVLCHKSFAQMRLARHKIFSMLIFIHIAVGGVRLCAYHFAFGWRHHRRSCLRSEVDAFVHGYLARKRIVAQSKAAGKSKITLNGDADGQRL